MTPAKFVAKWSQAALWEQALCQQRPALVLILDAWEKSPSRTRTGPKVFTASLGPSQGLHFRREDLKMVALGFSDLAWGGNTAMSLDQMIDLDAFGRDGYVVVEDILSEEELAEAGALIDELIPPDAQPPLVSGDGVQLNGRKQLIGDYCVPRLANIAGHPRLIQAAEALLGPLMRITQTSVPVVTYKSQPGFERFDFGYHVDWPHRPPEPGDDRGANCVLHLSTVQPGGGAFMLMPASHRFMYRCLEDPSLRSRVVEQAFEGLPGLPEPKEMCVPAGSAVFYHPFLVHDRSENLSDQPRKVLFVHFKSHDSQQQLDEAAAEARSQFHPEHVSSMDSRFRKLCGMTP